MIDDFIGVSDDALNKEHCEELIKIYEDSAELNFAISRKDMGVEKIHQDNNLPPDTELSVLFFPMDWNQ